MEQKAVFESGYNYSGLTLWFIFGCTIGTWYEEIITFIKLGEFESRNGVLYGPFNPLYGLGFLLVILIFKNVESIIKVFVIGGLIGGIFEFVLGYLQELFLGTISWNYEGQFLNIYGKTSIVYMAIWGIFAVLISKFIFPFFSNYFGQLPIKPWGVIINIFAIILYLNILLTIAVLGRQSLRSNGHQPITVIGEFIDNVYTDDVLKEFFPDMVKP